MAFDDLFKDAEAFANDLRLSMARVDALAESFYHLGDDVIAAFAALGVK